MMERAPEIIIDVCPFGGWSVEPFNAPAAHGKGRSFTAFDKARDYAHRLGKAHGARVVLMCPAPQSGEVAE